MTNAQAEKDLAQIERFIRDSADDRLFAKAMADAEREHRLGKAVVDVVRDDSESHEAEESPTPDAFPATREGLAAFATSAPMQRLARTDEAAFRQAYVDFALKVVGAGAMTPTEFGVATKELDRLIAMAGGVLAKAVAGGSPRPTPWQYERTVAGLQAFLKSDPMQTLKRQGMGDWTQCVLDFLTTIPGITPKQISEARLRLEGAHPDRPFVKSVGDLGTHLTPGQRVLMNNFGPDLADPNRWMIHR